jgi:hypothetical protein
MGVDQGSLPGGMGACKMPYSMLEFATKDPNGYILSFGQQVV